MPHQSRRRKLLWLCLLALGAMGWRCLGVESPAAANFRRDIQPLLMQYCADCHADGEHKGGVAFDDLKSEEALLGKPELWLAALKNTRAGLMPPAKKPRPTVEEQRKLEAWIKRDAFALDPLNPDPGRVTVRRLNRTEYRNTIRDLMGFDFKVEDELPPDDTGYGFDNIGDVLTVSPMLLEKYMQAAETIVAGAVPRVARVVPELAIPGSTFRTADGKRKAERLSFYDAVTVTNRFLATNAGSYRVVLDLEVAGEFDFDPGRCRVALTVDDQEVWQQEYGWQNGKKFHPEIDQKWARGEHRLALTLQPLVPVAQKKNSLDLKVAAVRVQGPTEKVHWGRPKNFDLFFTKDVPAREFARRQYAREVLRRFATKAFRRPVEERSLDRLVAIAEAGYREPGRSFEDGVATAMVPILASPRFLFRVENLEPTASTPGPGSPAPLGLAIDEYALASRLSYFLWSTMPDAELFRLAEHHELRRNLPVQVKRMLADPRSTALTENFVGQWLQVRDVEGIDINARAVMSRDRGDEKEQQATRKRFEELRAKSSLTPDEEKERTALLEKFRRFFRVPVQELDRDLRRALRQETEMSFAHVVREDRSVLELIECDYTFLNEKLAKHYGLTNVVGPNFTGPEMRRVTLPADSPRGGVLTDGAVLVVTSNPTRTSPVKRGLFVLDNILGIPPPPPPPDIPNLEESEKGFGDHQPTLRETLELHRSKPLCSSCHNRMDPLGLALENFNALGIWRDRERGQEIDAKGKLITGEAFNDIRELKHILVTNHRRDFYRCLSEKLLTYALGRGLEYYDTETVDLLVNRLDETNGRFSSLLMGIIDSAPFQKTRNPEVTVKSLNTTKPPQQRADLQVKP
ncbi:MAG TPA: DUF1592 domain-containing protein [Candidatus Limnocylindria bacterium]|nr:DUF1592 domain-containing protein [Candidatus Limnocylindria bacterium]